MKCQDGLNNEGTLNSPMMLSSDNGHGESDDISQPRPDNNDPQEDKAAMSSKSTASSLLPLPASFASLTASAATKASSSTAMDRVGLPISLSPVHAATIADGQTRTLVSAPRFVPVIPVGFSQPLRHAHESFTAHPTDATKMIARLRVPISNELDAYYEQTDTIPVLDQSATPPHRPSYYFIPDLTQSKLEKKLRASKKNEGQPKKWVRQGTSNRWTREDPKGGPDAVFEPKIMFRRFDSTTHKYEELYLNMRMLSGCDPNNQTWMYAYNKWIDQIRRRRDSTYTKLVNKDHWTVAERRALCEAINHYVRVSGLRRFGSGDDVQIPCAAMQAMADAVNAVGGKKRRPDAVRSQIFSSHLKKNKVIFDLIERAKHIRARLAAGEKIARAERYPDMAIPESMFPKDLTPKKYRHVSDEDTASPPPTASKKRKSAAAALEEDAEPDEEYPLSKSPQVPLPAYMQQFLMCDSKTSGLRPAKKVKLAATGIKAESASDDENQWIDTDDDEEEEEEEDLSQGNDTARKQALCEHTHESDTKAAQDTHMSLEEEYITPDEETLARLRRSLQSALENTVGE
ncbi:hypothetical protein ACEQ8H_008057 [Pleosporales sp. CAS-2024a]